MTASPTAPRTTSLAEIGERLAALRLCEAPALDAMRRSLERHGQLSPIVAFADGDQVQPLDGFTRPERQVLDAAQTQTARAPAPAPVVHARLALQ